MPDQVDVIEEAITLSDAETRELLDLVDEKQASREGRNLKASEVPNILLPYQARWHEDLAPVRLGEKSRRIGWSWAGFAAEGVLEAALPKGHPRGMNQYYMGYNMAMAAENIGDVVFFAQAFGSVVSDISVQRHREHVTVRDNAGVVIRNERRDITTYKVTFASGHIYEALSSNPHNWRGRQGHARIDEAAFHENLAEVVKAAMAFKLWGGRISIVSTHNGEENQFNLWIRDIKAGKLNWSHHHVDFDQALAEGFYKRVCLIRGLEWSKEAEQQYRADAFADYPDEADANEELLCIPKRGSGAYFTRILLEQCMEDGIPRLSWSQPDEWVTDPTRINTTRKWINDVLKPVIDNMPGQRSVYSQDFGRNGDLSVIWVLQNDSPLHWRQAFSLELRNMPFDVQAEIRDYIMENVPLLHSATFDARGNGQSHAEQAQQKFGVALVELVMATSSYYAVAFPKYKQAYEDRSITIAHSEDVIADHRLVELNKGNPRMADGRVKGLDGKPRHGDSTIAGLLAWMAAIEEGEPAYGETVESNNSADQYRPLAAKGKQRIQLFGRR